MHSYSSILNEAFLHDSIEDVPWRLQRQIYSINWIILNETFLVKLEVIKPLSICFLIYFINIAMRGSEIKYIHVKLFNFFHNSHELEV